MPSAPWTELVWGGQRGEHLAGADQAAPHQLRHRVAQAALDLACDGRGNGRAARHLAGEVFAFGHRQQQRIDAIHPLIRRKLAQAPGHHLADVPVQGRPGMLPLPLALRSAALGRWVAVLGEVAA